jgi:uncharacterized membrane protein YidH (DUF202 family)
MAFSEIEIVLWDICRVWECKPSRQNISKFPDTGRDRRIEMRLTIIAVVLIVLGVVALAYQGIKYTTREKAVDIGPIQVTTEKTKTIPLPPIAGASAVTIGIVLLIVGNRKGWK